MLLPNPASGASVGPLGAVAASDPSLAVSDAVRIEPAASLVVVEAACVAPEVVSATFAAALSARPEAGSVAADTAWALPSPAWGFVLSSPREATAPPTFTEGAAFPTPDVDSVAPSPTPVVAAVPVVEASEAGSSAATEIGLETSSDAAPDAVWIVPVGSDVVSATPSSTPSAEFVAVDSMSTAVSACANGTGNTMAMAINRIGPTKIRRLSPSSSRDILASQSLRTMPTSYPGSRRRNALGLGHLAYKAKK